MTNMTLADIVRNVHGNLSRNQLKAHRARLRRMGVTNRANDSRMRGPYAVDVATRCEIVTDPRALEGVVVASCVAQIRTRRAA